MPDPKVHSSQTSPPRPCSAWATPGHAPLLRPHRLPLARPSLLQLPLPRLFLEHTVHTVPQASTLAVPSPGVFLLRDASLASFSL